MGSFVKILDRFWKRIFDGLADRARSSFDIDLCPGTANIETFDGNFISKNEKGASTPHKPGVAGILKVDFPLAPCMNSQSGLGPTKNDGKPQFKPLSQRRKATLYFICHHKIIH
jgi:hypothetical protein